MTCSSRGNSTIGSTTGLIGDEALTNMLSYIQPNADVWEGWTWYKKHRRARSC